LQYQNVIDNIILKENILIRCLESLPVDIPKIINAEPKIFFAIPMNKIIKAAAVLKKDEILDNDSEKIFIDYLQNNFNESLRMKTNQNKIADLFLRIADKQIKSAGDKKDLTKALQNVRYYRNNKFIKIKHNYFLKLMYDKNKLPKQYRLLLNIFD
jgi:hypothetical protein